MLNVNPKEERGARKKIAVETVVAEHPRACCPARLPAICTHRHSARRLPGEASLRHAFTMVRLRPTPLSLATARVMCGHQS